MFVIKISAVCKALQSDERLAGGYNAIGYSQGGLLFWGLVQRCPYPPVRSVLQSHWSGSSEILCSDWLIFQHCSQTHSFPGSSYQATAPQKKGKCIFALRCVVVACIDLGSRMIWFHQPEQRISTERSTLQIRAQCMIVETSWPSDLLTRVNTERHVVTKLLEYN